MKLHQYTNLYFHARNPMMYLRRAQANDLCILRVSIAICQLDGVVFADSNASSEYVRFLQPSTQWQLLDFDDIYAMDWRHPNDPIAYYRHRSRKCAEVLVPQKVDPKLLLGAYVFDMDVERKLKSLDFSLPIVVEPVLFFR